MRAKATDWIAKAPKDTRVEFRGPRRSLPQNDLLWSLLTAVSEQVVWQGEKLSTFDWKDIFTASLRKSRVVQGIDPGSVVVIGLHSSTMDKEEMSNLIDLIGAFGAEHGVRFHDSEEAA